MRFLLNSGYALQASELQYARGIAEAHTGATITDAVVLVPPHFGPHQRLALADAVNLSGLTLLSLMNTHAAAALQYGIERDFTGKVEDVIVYDVSSTDIVGALVRFSSFPVKGGKEQSQFQVLDVAWAEGVGASFLDTILLKHFAKQVRVPDSKHCSIEMYCQKYKPTFVQQVIAQWTEQCAIVTSKQFSEPGNMCSL